VAIEPVSPAVDLVTVTKFLTSLIVANSFYGTVAATTVVAFALLSIFGTLGCAFVLRTWPSAPSLE